MASRGEAQPGKHGSQGSAGQFQAGTGVGGTAGEARQRKKGPGTDRAGWLGSPGTAEAGHCRAWHGTSWRGSQGRAALGQDVAAWQGAAGRDRRGSAWQGDAGPGCRGEAWPGGSRRRMARPSRHGLAGTGWPRLGMGLTAVTAGLGAHWLRMTAALGKQGSRGEPWTGWASRRAAGPEGLGLARPRTARHGAARQGSLGVARIARRGFASQGTARPSRHGLASSGTARHGGDGKAG